MKISKGITDKFQSLDRVHFEEIKDSEFRPPYDLFGLKYLRDKAGNERNMRELYRGRASYELLQNADDAGATKAAFILCRDGLAFIHDGEWFTVDNFRSLADGWSDKDPSECIGHKGLGFRSVLDITTSPYLLQVSAKGFFAIKFARGLNNGHIQETLQRNPSLRVHYDKWTRHGQTVCPIMAIPGLAKKRNLDNGAIIFDQVSHGTYGGDFTTMFWFPAKDLATDRKVPDEPTSIPMTSDSRGRHILIEFLSDEVSVLLPFLASIKTVTVYVDRQRIGLTRLSKTEEKQKYGKITVHTEVNSEPHSESFFQMRFAFPIPTHIRGKPDTPKAVKELKEAKVVLLVKLRADQPVYNDQSFFHVYFPTGELTGLGFVVHGDFYVKPDRTRLMGGSYNEWLLGKAAQVAANEFLTQLLQQYQPRSVFEALSPMEHAATTESAQCLVSSFSEALQKRALPFVPTNTGSVRQREVVLPPTVDKDGFWDSHFSDVVADLVKDKKALLHPDVDGERARAFLDLAGVQVLDHEVLLAFIEAVSQQVQPPEWWYECYAYMAGDRKFSGYSYSFFAGHKLIPTTDSTVINVPRDSNLFVCLPPTRETSSLRVPNAFSSVFVFLDFELAKLLEEGKDTIQSWVLDRLRISRFEATDLLPRAVRSVGPRLFSGDLPITPAELKRAWLFIKRIIDSSRAQIVSPSFWQDLGRFPLPVGATNSDEETLEPTQLAPAFLTYLPKSFSREEKSLAGITGLRRVDARFVGDLIVKSGKRRQEWMGFLKSVGVSALPRLLTYGRLAVGGQDIPFVSEALDEVESQEFSGERQNDENQVVVHVLNEEKLWEVTVNNTVLCDHDAPKVLQSLTVLEGLGACVQAAQQEYQNEDDNWRQRLWALVRGLRFSSIAQLEQGTVFCRGGRRGGHAIPIDSYLEKQLTHYRWLPSTQGPASSSECFVRFHSRRLISTGRSSEELGDQLFPYVIVDNVDDLARLQRLGVEGLDDAGSASPSTLVRALTILGERLSTEWGQQQILAVRSRWRLVRGAIQEIYRSLNQHQETLIYPPNIKFATRSSDRSDGNVVFQAAPLYYAEPGSTVEQAFLGTLPLIDADRPYPRFFEQIGVTRLTTGDTVDEKFLAEANSVPARRLYKEIIEQLSPYLLAPIIAKSDKSTQSETILRRLKDRFEVKAVGHLTVSYSLMTDPDTERTIEFPKFYLQRRVLPGPGAVQEAYYTLYAAGRSSIAFSDPDLDADALGAALSPIFLDGLSEELAGLFPRITSRYYHRRGNSDEMLEFMHRQLGISQEAQDMARAIASGETPPDPPPPPPAKVIHFSTSDTGTSIGDKQATIQETIQKPQKELEDFLQDIIEPPKEKPKKLGDPKTKTTTPARRGGPTDEQKKRGTIGEEEIKRRLGLPGGWEGFTLLEDTRKDGCGYDFLCTTSGRQVKLEVKTFTRDGQVFVTSTELQVAASSQNDYYMVGVLDDGGPEYEWDTFIIPNPIDILLAKGEFDIQTMLKALATEVFTLDQEK